ncbi:carbohydrate ABC transporter permease [Blautia massiliensis (ex Durand et al. 2017)]|uniref:carbohydrate ABC transporter permease n=1 Tax=Blautia massiliensis (ex Durand et al. 2017) TaxID=1737424 RepID=UPI00266D6CFD|nr:sugar ABC transporter permease [Blautia massiliensis (ex Durand et al. 2017)]
MAMSLPVIIIFFCFHTIPLFCGFFYSLTNSKGFGVYDIIGLKNYIKLFHHANILNAYAFTFKFAIVTTILVNVVSILLALGLNSKIHFKSTLRGLFFIPNILGGLIVGYIFNFLFTFVVPAVGEKLEIGWLSASILGSPKTAWIGIVICVAWQSIAFNTIIYISGLQTIPQDVYEAGEIDGAAGWKRFWKITFPLIAPFFTINMVLCMRNFLMVFDQIMSLTSGGPAQSTTSIAMLIYKDGLTGNQFGLQSANSVVYFIVIVAISAFQLKVLTKREVQL